jgi:hypothetical protein
MICRLHIAFLVDDPRSSDPHSRNLIHPKFALLVHRNPYELRRVSHKLSRVGAKLDGALVLREVERVYFLIYPFLHSQSTRTYPVLQVLKITVILCGMRETQTQDPIQVIILRTLDLLMTLLFRSVRR